MTHYALRMYDYHVWANQTLINRLKELPQEVYTQELQSVFPTISKAIAHIYLADRTWLDILRGHSMMVAMESARQITAQTESLPLDDIENLYTDLSRQFKSTLHRQENMEQLITLNNPYAGIRETSLAEIVLQIVNHGTYHRGNITAMLRQMSYASVMTEYALFWYEGQNV
ncbi:DinB family protein [Paenibacillus spongiae]|uniref:DinB family protein n=1 Tax=Paenibacillus spongiae TaxID=2909671 RepID=A0ABY5SGR6_9BACL|nr:DinB family protein [Paenibacillus spongiae]UVI32959.1 DinB family protein [Paenibacillus spongiae]